MENERPIYWKRSANGTLICGFRRCTDNGCIEVYKTVDGNYCVTSSDIHAEDMVRLAEIVALARDGEFFPPEPEHIRLLKKAKEILKDIPYLPRRENEISCDLRKQIDAYLEKEESE